MCLDFAARVVSCDGSQAVIEIAGRRHHASTLLMPDVKPGDWVRVAVGTIFERIDADQAALINDELHRMQEVSR